MRQRRGTILQAIVTDGTAVLGLGDIGPEAAIPVMEGKAILFKYLGGVDAWPVCLNTQDPDEIVRIVDIKGLATATSPPRSLDDIRILYADAIAPGTQPTRMMPI